MFLVLNFPFNKSLFCCQSFQQSTELNTPSTIYAIIGDYALRTSACRFYQMTGLNLITFKMKNFFRQFCLWETTVRSVMTIYFLLSVAALTSCTLLKMLRLQTL